MMSISPKKLTLVGMALFFMLLLSGVMSMQAAPAALPLKLVEQYGGATNDVAAVGDTVYLAYGERLVVLDASNKSALQVVGRSEAVGEDIREIVVQGTTIFGRYDDKLIAFDVSNKSAPRILDTFDAKDFIRSMYVSNGRVYLGVNNKTGVVVNSSNPSLLTEIGSFFTKETPFAMYVRDNYAYVGSVGELIVFDISELGIEDNEVGRVAGVTASEIIASGRYMYTAEGEQLYVLDINNLAMPVLKGTYSSDIHITDKLYIADDTVYMSGVRDPFDEVGFLSAVDVTNPAAPMLISSIDTPDRTRFFAIANGFAFVDVSPTPEVDTPYSYRNDLGVFDVGNLNAISQVSTYQTIDRFNDVVVRDGTAFVAHPSGLYVASLNQSEGLSVVGLLPLAGSPERIVVVGNTAFLSTEEEGVYAVDVGDPANPIELSNFATDSDRVNDIVVENNRMYVAAFQDFLIYDVSNPAAPTLLLETSSYDHIAVRNSVLYAADFDDLIVFDASSGASLQELARLEIDGRISALVIDGSRLFVDHFGIDIYDVSEPANLSAVGAIEKCCTDSFWVEDGRFYYTDKFDPPGIQDGTEIGVIDVADLDSQTVLGTYFINYSNVTRRVFVDGDRFYVAIGFTTGGLFGFETSVFDNAIYIPVVISP